MKKMIIKITVYTSEYSPLNYTWTTAYLLLSKQASLGRVRQISNVSTGPTNLHFIAQYENTSLLLCLNLKKWPIGLPQYTLGLGKMLTGLCVTRKKISFSF